MKRITINMCSVESILTFMEAQIERCLTSTINKECPYYDDISLLVSRQRGRKLTADTLVNEDSGELLLYIENGRAVSILRFYKNWYYPHFKWDNIYINLVHTLEEYRGRGYSTMLFKYLFQHSKLPCALEVSPSNNIARNLYKKLGFEEHPDVSYVYDKHFIKMTRPADT